MRFNILSNNTLRQTLILFFPVLFYSCSELTCKDKDKIVKIDNRGDLSSSELEFIPYSVGDTLCLVNTNDTISLICDSLFNSYYVIGIQQISNYPCDGLIEIRGKKTGYIFNSKKHYEGFGDSKFPELKLQLESPDNKNTYFFIVIENLFDSHVSICDSCELIYILNDQDSRHSKYYYRFLCNDYVYDNVIGLENILKLDTTKNNIDSIYFNRDNGIIQIVYSNGEKYSIKN